MTAPENVPADARAVLDFWFVQCTPEQWFKKDAALDAEVLDRFGALHGRACAGALDHWMSAPESALALIVLIDQFSRNLHRDSPEAFAQDGRACQLVGRALEAGFDRGMTPNQRQFLYMPLMHSEDLDHQDRCVALMHDAGLEKPHGFAVRHRDIIARFGRFPHRNAVLGRPSTAEEKAFLNQPGSSF